MKLYVVGIGPGDPCEMTPRAAQALEQSDVIVGYVGYVQQLRSRFSEKELLETPMRRETERCRMAVERALAGEKVAVISSGDAGVYGMAGLVLELAKEHTALEVEVVPGITAACSGAAVLGAPLGHDFAVISLSDLLTPWELIERRLHAAAQADFCICLYNPGSQKRADYLRRACEILLAVRPGDTAAGFVRNIGREGQQSGVMTLAELQNFEADMFTTLFIGNSQTYFINERMITPRGYKNG